MSAATITREDVIEAMLIQAVATIEFLHGCLTNPIYSYDYPGQTVKHLADFSDVLPEQFFCVHSVTQSDCPSCAQGARYREVMAAWHECPSAFRSSSERKEP